MVESKIGHDHLVINRNWLLWIYTIVPLCVLVVLIDQLLLGGLWQPFLTTAVLFLPVYLLFFELPHILASLFTFADSQYIAYYKKQLFVVLPILLAGFVALFLYSPVYGFAAYAVYTMYHVIRQQTGVAIIVSRYKDRFHELWSYLGVLTGAAGFVLIFLADELPVDLALVGFMVLPAIAAIFCAVSYVVAIRTTNRLGRFYILAVASSLVCGYFFLVLDYVFLAIFVLRFTHDVTAFLIYIAHDHNRNNVQSHNVLYTLFVRCKIPLVVAMPCMAIAIAFILRSELQSLWYSVYALMLVAIAHYYLEGVMWKRDTPHRQQLEFV